MQTNTLNYSISSGWFQEHAKCGEDSFVSRESRQLGQGRLHLRVWAWYSHWWRSRAPRHHQRRRQNGAIPAKKRLEYCFFYRVYLGTDRNHSLSLSPERSLFAALSLCDLIFCLVDDKFVMFKCELFFMASFFCRRIIKKKVPLQWLDSFSYRHLCPLSAKM